MTHNVGIFVFDEVEVLDFAGPFEVFTTASRMHARLDPASPPLFKVFTVGEGTAVLCARAGLRVLPDHAFWQHPPIDVLVIPGGVVEAALARPAVIGWITATAAASTLTASVCTGAFLLARAGLLDGKCATTHWEDADDLARDFPAVTVQKNVRWVDDGDGALVTSAGISAGIDMSLHLVEKIAGRELAVRTARQMEFDWTENA